MRILKKLLAGALLAGAVATPLAIGQAPAQASSVCDYTTKPGSAILGGYVQLNGVYYRSVCATITAQRLSASQVNFSGWTKDSATDGKNELVIAQFRVNGQWGDEKVLVYDGTESWHTWSFPVHALGTVDQAYITACS